MADTAPVKRVGLTDKRCKKVGIQMAHQRIFHSAFCSSPDEVARCFPLISFMSNEEREVLAEQGVVAFYANYSTAAPRAINGLPMFFAETFNLTREENSKVIEAYNEELTRMKEFDDDEEGDST